MKKILSIVAALMLSLTFSVMAQVEPKTVIEKPDFWDNNYVSLTVGGCADMKINAYHLKTYPELNVYVGHWFTPVWGVELNGGMTMWDSFKNRDYFVKSSYVGVSGIVNLNNWIAGYSNEPRLCEVIPFVGIGWLHGYTRGSGDTNDFATKMGVDVRFNLNEHWALDVRPNVMYNLTGGTGTKYNVNHGNIGLEIGATYTIGKRFVQSEVVDYADWASLNDEVNALRARKVAPETVYVTKTVVENNTEFISSPVNIGFTLDSDVIDYTQMAAIANVASSLKSNSKLTAVVYGYADADTGTPEYNMNLSERRANAVKNVLVEMGVDESRIVVEPEGSCTQIYNENDWNRAAVITVK